MGRQFRTGWVRKPRDPDGNLIRIPKAKDEEMVPLKKPEPWGMAAMDTPDTHKKEEGEKRGKKEETKTSRKDEDGEKQGKKEETRKGEKEA